MSDPVLDENTPDLIEHHEPEVAVEADGTDELMSESLVEEVSIDGMCGVY